MKEGTQVTNNYFSARPLLAQWLLWIGLTLISCIVNVLSIFHEASRNGDTIILWKPWLLELSSFAGWCVTYALLLPWDRKMVRRRLRLPLRLAVYALASVVFSAIHIATMVGLRKLGYWLTGTLYHFGQTGPEFLYEYRKDLMSYLLVITLTMLWRRRLQPQMVASPAPPTEPAFLVPGRDGEMLVRAGEIDWIEAQGNYVALHVSGQERLLRQPLKDIEAKLAGVAFIRTHRSALVNLKRVKGITRSELGEIRVEFANRDSAPLSASRRAEVVKALAAG
jgi:hypothetical protein